MTAVGGTSRSGLVAAVGDTETSGSPTTAPASDTAAGANVEASLADLSNELAESAQAFSLASNVSSIHHRIGVNIIGNMKA